MTRSLRILCLCSGPLPYPCLFFDHVAGGVILQDFSALVIPLLKPFCASRLRWNRIRIPYRSLPSLHVTCLHPQPSTATPRCPLCPDNADLLAELQTCQACSHLRTLPLRLPSPWFALPSSDHWLQIALHPNITLVPLALLRSVPSHRLHPGTSRSYLFCVSG